MFLKDYYPNLNKKYSNIKFKGISFNSKLIKKNYIFLQLKEMILMEINLLMMQLKKGQQ